MKLNIFITLILFFITNFLYSQTTVFSDDFNTPGDQSSTYLTSDTLGSKSWNINRSGNDWGARIFNDIIDLTNDASSASNANGWIFVYQQTSNFLSPFNSTLSQNTSNVNYIFNMRQIRDNPAGFNTGSYGVAFIIGSTGNSKGTGNGYAVVLGQSGTIDPIRFVKFTNGLNDDNSLTNLIVAPSPLNDIGAEYLSIAVKYYPSTNKWELYGRVDGTSNFGDPLDGNLVFLGEVTDNTYTNTALDYMGLYWQGSTAANQTAYFDNVNVILGDPPLPVVLSNYKINLNGGKVILTWSTATEVQNYGWEIERSKVDKSINKASSWQSIGFVKGAGNSNSPKEYSFVDNSALYGEYAYRLKQIDIDGSTSYSDELRVFVGKKPEVYDVKAFPNPFNPETKIRFELPEAGNVKLSIYDLTGRLITTLVDEYLDEGIYEREFNGSNLSSGIYFTILQSKDVRIVRKMQLIK